LNKHKAKGSDAGKKNNKIRRAVVGLFVTAWISMSIFMGANYYMLSSMIIGAFMFREMISIQRRYDKDSINYLSGPALEWFIYFVSLYFYTPRINLRPSLMKNSGFGSKDYPLLHDILHTYRTSITAGLISVIFLWFILSL